VRKLHLRDALLGWRYGPSTSRIFPVQRGILAIPRLATRPYPLVDRGLALPCAMKLAHLGGVDLEYAVEGVGEPVVLVHAGAVADFFAPLVGPLARSGRFRVVHYHRVGYGGSSRPGTGDADMAEQARQCQALLQQLDVERAHVVGHSSGGLIATQLALDAPEVVGTLALLEPVDLEVPSAAEFGQQVLGPAFQRYAMGTRKKQSTPSCAGSAHPTTAHFSTGSWDRQPSSRR